MPKKFIGENSKASAARARKNEKNAAEKAKKEKEIEDALWRDDDKSLAKKQARKVEAERKRQEAFDKKKEREAMVADEEAGILESLAKKVPSAKVTRAQIMRETERREAAAKSQSQKSTTTHLEQPLEDNLNRVMTDGVTANNVEDAISALSLHESNTVVDRHPEKRVKAAYEAFEKSRLPQLKAEHSNLRLSQLKQMMRKEWMKSPNNPLNQRILDASAAQQTSPR